MDLDSTLTNRLTDNFSNYMKNYEILYKNLAKKCKTYLSSDIKRPIILDIGSGPGILTKTIKENHPNAFVIGIEPSDAMIKTVKKEKVSYELIQGKVEQIPIKQETIDCIITRYSLPYWIDAQKGIKEIYKILKPGGHVLFEALNRNYPKWKLKLIKYQMNRKKAPNNVIKYHLDAYKLSYTIEELEEKLIHENFTIVEQEYKKHDWRYLIIAEKAHD